MSTSADFHAERRTGLGGSDMGAVLGLNRYKTPLQVWQEKTGRAPPTPSSLPMRFGTFAEQFVAEEYTRLTGRQVERYTGLLRHPSAPLIGHVDRLVIPDGAKRASHKGQVRAKRLLECKTSNPFALNGGEWGESGTDLVPQSYLVQCSVYLALSGCEVADLACLFGNQEVRIYEVPRNPDLEGIITATAKDWWNRYVVADVPPPPSTADECRALYPSHKPGLIVEATQQIAAAVKELIEVKSRIKLLEASEAEIEGKIMSALGEAETLTVDGNPVATWRQNKPSKKTDWKGLAEYLGPPAVSLVEQFSSENPGARVLRIKSK